MSQPEWDLWAMPKDQEHGPRADLLFEMHPLWLVERMHGRKYIEHLQRCGRVVMMPERYDEIPYSEEYPLRSVIDITSRDYFGSTIAYMLGLALLLRPQNISLYGVDLGESIYDHQRPNLEYLIGMARGMGIRVFAAVGGALFEHRSGSALPDGAKFRYPVRYGYDPEVIHKDAAF